ncbi:MAG: hypothetical protein HRT94_04000 [Alphaproteobacteria bacterium]|nr:hypothetical protein [Alphaproteobacteria bacterium]
MKFPSFKSKTTDTTDQQFHVLLPILGVTLFFSYWFSHYSFEGTFDEVYEVFTIKGIFADFPHQPYSWMYIVTILSLGIIITPFKDNSPSKWGLLVFLAFVLFGLKNLTSFPYVANHGMMMVCLLVGYFIIIGAYILRGRASEIFSQMDYLGLMRMSLLIMYFFGTFHKINSGFLHNDGCWRVFYDTIPFLPDFFLRPEIAVPLGGYGTLVLESIAMVMLFFPKTKYYGMLLGMSFHFIIGVAGTGPVAHFSAFAFALHMSFLSTDAIPKFKASKFWLWLNQKGRGAILLRVPFIAYMVTIVVLSYIYDKAYDGPLVLYEKYLPFLKDVPYLQLNTIKTMWLLYSVPIMLFVLLYGRTPQERPANFVTSRVMLANIASVLLLFNSITPYIGLKASTDLAMFSNLQTEWGTSNHYLIPKPPYIFPYLEKENYIFIIDSSKRGGKTPDPHTHYDKTWMHISAVRKESYKLIRDLPEGVKLEDLPEEELKKHWLKYMDSEGNVHYIDGTDHDHPFLERPNWWQRNYLTYVKYVDMYPAPCSSR